MQVANIGEVALHYEHRPRPGRPLLVFVNALGTDLRIWDEVAGALAADLSILRYDKRGHGLSDLGASPCAMEDHAADLAGLIGHVGAKQAIVCGLSAGGLVAQRLAAQRPELVRGLVLCDTAHRIGSEAFWDERIAVVQRDGIAAIAEGNLARWFTPAFHAAQPARVAAYRNMLIRQPLAGYVGTCAALRDADHSELVRRIAVPTLCLVGEQDATTPPELVRSMAEMIPGAEFAVIAGAGHLLCVERPDELAARMRAFLRGRGLAEPGDGR